MVHLRSLKFQPERDTIKDVAVWIRIIGLPIEYMWMIAGDFNDIASITEKCVSWYKEFGETLVKS